jgi:hypothetical protein
LLTVGFDLDGVLAQTHERMIEILQEKGKVSADKTIEDAVWWEFAHNPETGEGFPGVTQEDLLEVFMDPSFWANLKTHGKMIEAINYSYRTCDTHVVTDRRWYPELLGETQDWLACVGANYDFLEVVKGTDKGEYCSDNRIDIFVDDRLKNIVAVAPHVKHAYLLNRPWTANEKDLPENVELVTVDEFIEKLHMHVKLAAMKGWVE